MYHGVPSRYRARNSRVQQVDAKSFREHIGFLQRHTTLVSPLEVDVPSRSDGRPKVLLTFDDGMLNHFDVVMPILRHQGVPALFFICRRNTEPGRYLWFTYLYAIDRWFPWNEFIFRGDRMDMTPAKRAGTMARLRRTLLSLRPHPEAMYAAIEQELPILADFVESDVIADCYAGISVDQIKSAASDSLFSLGAHTVDHPYLTLCDPEERRRQISDSKTWLETLTGTRCEAFAYPAGDYNDAVVNECMAVRIDRAYAIDTRLKTRPRLEMPRLGIYSSDLKRLSIKVGWGRLLRDLRINIG